MGRVIAIANQKGGVGKTTTSVNLSAAFAQFGRRVLVIDVDPQGNATSGFGVDKHGLEASLYDVFAGIFNLSSVIVGTELPSLWVAPANIDLVGVEVELSQKEGREMILKQQLQRLREQFDYIFLDCPPSLGLLTVNALAAADSLLVPLQAEYYALEGISALMQTYEVAKGGLNPNLELEGVLLTMYDARTNLSKQVGWEAREFFGEKVFEAVIPRNVRLSESPSFGKPIFLYDPLSPGATAYLAVAKEMERRHSGLASPASEMDAEMEAEVETGAEPLVANS